MGQWGRLQFPWRPGAMRLEGDARVWVTASRLQFDSFLTYLRSAPHAIALRARWGELPDAVGMSLRVEPLRLASWTVSMWSTPTGSRDFVRSAAHTRIMRRYSALGVTGTELSWTTDRVDVESAWRRAVAELEPR